MPEIANVVANVWEFIDLPVYLFLVLNGLLLTASALVYAERRVAGIIQERIGPNRVGPQGLLQPFADVFKLIFKEDIRPSESNRFLHSVAPTLMVVIAMTTVAVMPVARGVVVADISVGGLLVLALGTSAALLGARGVASDALRLAALGLGAGLLVFVAGAILRDVLRTRDVTPTTLAGASSVYLLLGTAFGVAFLTLESVAPGSFHEGGAAPVTEGWNAYLSLVTLSTLGYGDVVPVTRTARALAATEALLGQLYLTILVARLVGLQLGGARGESRAGP